MAKNLTQVRTAPRYAAAALCWALACHSSAWAAPDEVRLGKAQGYPVAGVGNNQDWFYDEGVRVGSFTHQAEIPGLYGGRANRLDRSPQPMPLPRAQAEPAYRWAVGTERGLGVDDFLARQRIMGLLIVKDGVVQVERYQYARQASQRFTSQSMAKSIASLAIGFALSEGQIRSLDDRADVYAPKLAGTVLGASRIRHLLLMASGISYQQSYAKNVGDMHAFGLAVARVGIEAAAGLLKQGALEPGTRFAYASPNSLALAAVLRGATGMSLSEYLTPRLWQAIGAEDHALWLADKTGLEVALGNFNATLRDYARLGIVLANDGARADGPVPRQVVPRDYLLQATDWQRLDPPFHPAQATPGLGYGYQFWLYPGAKRRFILLGVYGQSIFVDPGAKLVVVMTAANASAEAGDTSLARERDAFWRGLMNFYPASGR